MWTKCEANAMRVFVGRVCPVERVRGAVVTRELETAGVSGKWVEGKGNVPTPGGESL